MEISKITIFKGDKEKSIVAIGKVTLSKVIVIDHRIIKKKDGSGFFAKLGTDHKSKDGKYYSDVFIDDAEDREAINQAILEAYNKGE